MLPNYYSSTDLLENITKNKLYTQLIVQLNKDFCLANIGFNFSKETPPLALKEKLKKTVKNLIFNDFNTYKNLLYIVDVPEGMVKNIEFTDIDIYTENINFLILKRVWKKVWLKNKYSS